MADFIFNVAKGAAAEKVRDSGAVLGVLILRTTGLETDAVLRDKTTVADLLSGTTDEPGNLAYARKVGLTATLSVDQANDRVDLDLPDQTWTAVLAGDNWSKAVVFYEDSASDAGRIPLSSHDFAVTTDGSDITLQFAAAGFYRAA